MIRDSSRDSIHGRKINSKKKKTIISTQWCNYVSDIKVKYVHQITLRMSEQKRRSSSESFATDNRVPRVPNAYI